jgi:4,5-dihydroxyphthalate decarboxylase
MVLKLNVAFSDNPRIQPLRDGTVKPEGIELNFIDMGAGWIFHRNLYFDEFDASEMSISSTFLAVERRGNTGKWDWSALPVFLSTGGLVWSENTYVNTSSGVNTLGEIKGKRIGVPDYEMTAALWMKIVMKDMYGIEAGDNVWYNGRTAELSRDEALGLDKDPVPGVERQWMTEDQTLDGMLATGGLDAAFFFLPRRSEGDTQTMERYGGTSITDPRIKLLLPDKGKAVFAEYHKKFGHRHQPNHHVIVQNRVLRDHPWAALELMRAFQRSKEVAYERQKAAIKAFFVYEGSDFSDQANVYGEDLFPIGMQAMGKTAQRMIQGSLEQGLLRKDLKLEDVYFRTTLET